MEVPAQQAELPELVGHVLAHVGHGAVAPHDDLVRVGHALEVRRLREGHDPAAPVLVLRIGGHEVHGARRLELLEAGGPETALQDVALVGQDGVADAQAVHGAQVAADHLLGHEGRHVGGLVVPRLHEVQRVQARRLPVLRFRVPRAHAGVEIPALLVEGPVSRILVFGEGDGEPDAIQVPVQDALEPHHHIGHLDARVVDVVLHLHRAAQEAQALDEGVAQDGVAQVPHVGGLVGVDVGVLDDDLARHGAGHEPAREQVAEGRPPVQVEVEVATGRPDLAHARQRDRGQLGGNGGGRAFQELRQGEAHGRRRVAQLGLGREHEGHLIGRPRHAELVPDRPRQLRLPLPHRRQHERSFVIPGAGSR